MSGLAIMALDPGGKSGVSWGWFNAEADSVGAALRRARRKHSLFAAELSGTPHAQAWWVARQWTEFHFYSTVELGCRSDDVVFVYEDFELRQRHVDTAPVSVTDSLLTLLQQGRLTSREGRLEKRPDAIVVFSKADMFVNGEKTDMDSAKIRTSTSGYPLTQPIPQKASAAMTFATNKRLKQWDAWFVGSEHMRDATRHLATRLNRMLD